MLLLASAVLRQIHVIIEQTNLSGGGICTPLNLRHKSEVYLQLNMNDGKMIKLSWWKLQGLLWFKAIQPCWTPPESKVIGDLWLAWRGSTQCLLWVQVNVYCMRSDSSLCVATCSYDLTVKKRGQFDLWLNFEQRQLMEHKNLERKPFGTLRQNQLFSDSRQAIQFS